MAIVIVGSTRSVFVTESSGDVMAAICNAPTRASIARRALAEATVRERGEISKLRMEAQGFVQLTSVFTGTPAYVRAADVQAVEDNV